MDVEIKSWSLSDSTAFCSFLTLFYMKDGKVIGTANFHENGCDILLYNPDRKKIIEDFTIMANNGLYDIFGDIKGLKLNSLNEVCIENRVLLPRAIDYVMRKGILSDTYQEQTTRRR